MDAINNIVEHLCQGESKLTQEKIQAAYWAGCAEGMEVADAIRATKRAVKRTDGNVIFLKDRVAK